MLETSVDSYLIEPVSDGAHIAYEVKQSPLPEVENIGGANEDGGKKYYIYSPCGDIVVTVVSALPCPKLDDPENGDVMVDGYHPGSSATYQCAEGYRLIGPHVRQCLPTALWSGTTPVCVATDIAGKLI